MEIHINVFVWNSMFCKFPKGANIYGILVLIRYDKCMVNVLTECNWSQNQPVDGLMTEYVKNGCKAVPDLINYHFNY